MATNKATSELTNKPSPSGPDFFRYGSVGQDWNITWDQIINALQNTGISTQSILVISDTTYILNLGLLSVFGGFTIDYLATRATRVRKEILQIVTDGSTVQLLSSGFKTIPDTEDETCGLSFSVDINMGYVRLLITSDSSDPYQTKFIYNKTQLPI